MNNNTSRQKRQQAIALLRSRCRKGHIYDRHGPSGSHFVNSMRPRRGFEETEVEGRIKGFVGRSFQAPGPWQALEGLSAGCLFLSHHRGPVHSGVADFPRRLASVQKGSKAAYDAIGRAQLAALERKVENNVPGPTERHMPATDGRSPVSETSGWKTRSTFYRTGQGGFRKKRNCQKCPDHRAVLPRALRCAGKRCSRSRAGRRHSRAHGMDQNILS